MNIDLVIYCPECGEELTQEMALVNAKKPEVNLSYFEQTDWECEDCGSAWAIGSINIEHRERLLG